MIRKIENTNVICLRPKCSNTANPNSTNNKYDQTCYVEATVDVTLLISGHKSCTWKIMVSLHTKRGKQQEAVQGNPNHQAYLFF
jgi:hypothetical protein